MEQININDFEGVFEIMDQSFPQDERRKKEEQRALFSVPEYKVFVCRAFCRQPEKKGRRNRCRHFKRAYEKLQCARLS